MVLFSRVLVAVKLYKAVKLAYRTRKAKSVKYFNATSLIILQMDQQVFGSICGLVAVELYEDRLTKATRKAFFYQSTYLDEIVRDIPC